MVRLTNLALLMLPLGAAPALAQDNRILSAPSKFSDPALQLERKGFAFPVIEYSDNKGSRQTRRGIIASKEIAPEMLVGLGLFETAPKVRGYAPEPLPTARPKRSRQAAVGFSWRF